MYKYTVRKGNKHSVERIKTKLNLLSLLIFSVISFQFNGENYLQIHGTAEKPLLEQHLQGTAPNIVQKAAFPFTHESSKTLERLKHARIRRSRPGP